MSASASAFASHVKPPSPSICDGDALASGESVSAAEGEGVGSGDAEAVGVGSGVAVGSAEGLEFVDEVQAARISSVAIESARGNRVIGLTGGGRSAAVHRRTASCAS